MCQYKEEILPVKANRSTEVASTLSNNNFHDKVNLRTVCVEIVGQGNKWLVLGLLDSTYFSSYVSDRVANCLKLRPLRHEKVIHGLIEGKETPPIEHGIYAVEIHDLNGSFKCCCEMFSEGKICGFVPKIEDLQISENLRVNKIELSDVTCSENEVDLLIRADLIVKLLMISNTRAILGRTRNFEPRSDDEDDTSAGTPALNFHATPTGGCLAITYDLTCSMPHTRRIISGIVFRIWNLPASKPRPYH
ncbi:hypothetical protein AVEN_236349-1 [Araneus ventricosus]|uniref:Uncharacterized protein n=1 Tax=Araneus ventricosus TaxID=182803 RepID=A0A4Y2TPQ0_ARAVE|nr:hypothetical protein AVEN_1465-1 [Araneus ventricosus]GBO02247.1 hypothetical protein AVEN_236349-1 [Araneus ventricosus]